MDIRDLELLCALSEHRHFARAADACGISQPAFSARIGRLEEALGAAIVRRGNRFEGFTPEGDLVLARARRILAETAALDQELRESRGALGGEARIGVIPSALPETGAFLAGFARNRPAVRLIVASMSSIEIAAGLASFSLTAGVTYLDNEPLKGVCSAPLYTEQLMLLAPDEAQWAGRTTVTWAEAAELRLGLLTPDMQNRRIVDAAFRAAGVRVAPTVEASSFTVLATLVADGGFATVAPRGFARTLAPGGAVRGLALEAPEVAHVVGLVTREEQPRAPLARALHDEATAHGRRAGFVGAAPSRTPIAPSQKPI